MHLTEALSAREPTIGCWITIGHPAVAEVLAPLGFDFLVLEHEHAPNGIETLADLARGVEAASDDLDAVIRLAWNDPVLIKRALDVGATGVMIPMIESAEEAEDAVAAARYPPEGWRGVAGSRATGYGRDVAEAVATANDRTVVIAQIETPTGAENAAEIAAVDGVDGVFVGPADLSATTGGYAEWTASAFEDAVERIATAARDAGTAVGTVGAGDAIAARMEWGLDFVIAGTDVSYLRSGAREAQRAVEGAD